MHEVSVQRRTSMPSEFDDLDDCTVSEPDPGIEHNQHELVHDTLTPQESSSSNNITIIPKELRNLLAGGVAGMVAKSVVAPLERIKILFQVTSAEFRLSSLPKVAKNIIRNEGLSALWKGNIATMARVFPYSGIQFMMFDRLKTSILRQHDHDRRANKDSTSYTTNFGLTPYESLGAGMIAGTVSVCCTYPLDLARAQLAVLRRHKNSHTVSFTELISSNYRQRGIQGLYRGISITVVGMLPYAGIAFTLNEQGKRKIQNMKRRDLTTIERLQCGAFAGLVAQTVTYPIEVTRRRMQTLGLVGSDTAFGNVGVTTQGPTRPPTLRETIQHLYREQGVRGFFKGVSMNWMKGPIAFSISFTTFDTVQQLMESESERALRLPRRFKSLRRDA